MKRIFPYRITLPTEAETPTAAAVLAVPDTSEMIGRAEEWKLQMNARMHRILELGEIRAAGLPSGSFFFVL